MTIDLSRATPHASSMAKNIILLEGIDGCGKSTVSQKLLHLADEDGLSAVCFRDPGCTSLGEEIRKITANPDIPMTPVAQTLAFMSARLQLVAYIEEVLDQFGLIVLDRYWQSTIAYQCFGGDVPLEFVLSTVESTNKLYPDVYIPLVHRFGLMIDPQVAHERRMADPKRSGERFKQADMDFKHRVADGYQWLVDHAMLTPITVGDSSADAIAQTIYDCWRDS